MATTETVTAKTRAEEVCLDGILERARIAWAYWRLKHPDHVGRHLSFAEVSALDDDDMLQRDLLADALTFDLLPDELRALATDDRVWDHAAWTGERTPGECIVQIVQQLAYLEFDAMDKGTR